MFQKLVTIITLLTLVAFSAFFLQKYLPYRDLMASSSNHGFFTDIKTNVIMNNTQSMKALNYLNELTEVPLIGFLFDEKKIIELVRLERYQEGIEES
jgi:hypothetical protein